MNITKQDVGRRVVLRNGETAEIVDFIDGNAYPVFTDEYTYTSYGCEFKNEESEWDIVAFADEQPTIDRSWVIGPFDSLETMRQCWEVLRGAGEPTRVESSDLKSLLGMYGNKLAFMYVGPGMGWLVSVMYEPTITPTEFLQRMGRQPVPEMKQLSPEAIQKAREALTNLVRRRDSIACTCTSLLFGHATSCALYRETEKDKLDKAVGFAIRQPVFETYITTSDEGENQ